MDPIRTWRQLIGETEAWRTRALTPLRRKRAVTAVQLLELVSRKQVEQPDFSDTVPGFAYRSPARDESLLSDTAV